MATVEFEGIEQLERAFIGNQLPKQVKEQILLEMANYAAQEIKSKGKSMGIFDPEWDGTHMLDSVKVGKPKITETGGYVDISFGGARVRGDSRTTNSRIAFLNEYGANDKDIPPRPFVNTTLVEKEKAIVEKGEEPFNEYYANMNK